MSQNLCDQYQFDKSISQECATPKVYSPTQVACGAIGGPVGLVYFLWANFSALNNENLKKKTLIYGSVLISSLIAIAPFFDEGVPGIPFTIASIIAARIIADKYQMTKADIIESSEYNFHSNWRVFGLGLLCFVGSIVIFMGPLLLLVVFGVVDVQIVFA